MASSLAKSGFSATPPTFAVKGAHNSLLLEMAGLGKDPASGRLLRGLTPYLDEQGADHVFLLTERRRREEWNPGDDQIVVYQELVHWRRGADGGVYRGVCSKGELLKREEIVRAFEIEPLSLIDWAARRMEAAIISSDAPLQLESCIVSKPWGREIWYTGIESRGVSRVRGQTGATELPYALGMFPLPIVGDREEAPLLLKVLDPLPDEIYGDLYLEVHREKWETYVVLSVDPSAWPDGAGALMAGLAADAVEKTAGSKNGKGGKSKTGKGKSTKAMSPKARQKALAGELKERITAYEKVRRGIDAKLDLILSARGVNTDQPVPPELHRELVGELPKSLQSKEKKLRGAVEKMLGRIPLRPGDVVTLPPGVLHSLRHGVKVIEFQTPTYERLIAMFAQKVLTQPDWDVSEVLSTMNMSPYRPPETQVLQKDTGVWVEQVVDFPQFQVHRIRMDTHVSQEIHTEGHRYRLMFVTEGAGEMVLPNGETVPLTPETAFLLPAEMGAYTLLATSGEGLTYLEASPNPMASTAPGEKTGKDKTVKEATGNEHAGGDNNADKTTAGELTAGKTTLNMSESPIKTW